MYLKILLGILITIFLSHISMADDWGKKYLIDSQGDPIVTENYECVKISQPPSTSYTWPDRCYSFSRDDDSFKEINFSGDVMFASNSSILSPLARDILKKLIAQTDMYTLKNMTVIGHTDNIGSQIYNQTLSTKRAANVVNYLMILGIPAYKLNYYGVGELNPIAVNTTVIGRALNRRVTIQILQ